MSWLVYITAIQYDLVEPSVENYENNFTVNVSQITVSLIIKPKY